ncbi:MAG: DEAD/DEAH box helicase [Rhodospirillaceae bacterium]
MTASNIQYFSDLGLSEPLMRAIKEHVYKTPTPIQKLAVPILLEGRDLIGCAQTGTGKTAAFAWPILQQLLKNPLNIAPKSARVLVLCPTRELANQIHEDFGAYGRYISFRRTAIYGGVNIQRQVKTMNRGVEVLVATPGRLLDLMNQGRVDLRTVRTLVFDEADRMLDMGFLPDIRRIVDQIPKGRQTLMFSATMSPAIEKLAKTLLRNPLRVAVAPPSTIADNVVQKLMLVERSEKTNTLIKLLNDGIYKAIVFTRTKHGANRLDAQLHKNGIKTVAIHGNKSQNQRAKALANFEQGHMQVLVATDVAARGLDIDDVSHVINYDMPDQPDSYIHRIGRTGRAGANGTSISFCASHERGLLRDIERMVGYRLEVSSETLEVGVDHPEYLPQDIKVLKKKKNYPDKNKKNRKKPPRKAHAKNTKDAAKGGGKDTQKRLRKNTAAPDRSSPKEARGRRRSKTSQVKGPGTVAG